MEQDGDIVDKCPAYCFAVNGKWSPCDKEVSANGCCSDEHAMHLFMVAEQEYSMYIDAIESEDYEKANEYHTALRFKSMISRKRVVYNEQSKTASTKRRLKNHFKEINSWMTIATKCWETANFNKCEIYNCVHKFEKKCLDAITSGDKLEDIIEQVAYYKKNVADFFKELYRVFEENHQNTFKNKSESQDNLTNSLVKIEELLRNFKKRGTVSVEPVGGASSTQS